MRCLDGALLTTRHHRSLPVLTRSAAPAPSAGRRRAPHHEPATMEAGKLDRDRQAEPPAGLGLVKSPPAAHDLLALHTIGTSPRPVTS